MAILSKTQFLQNNVDEREIVFVEVIYDLLMLSDHERKEIADSAGVHWTTLYAWMSVKTRKPRLDTVCRVARALGYEVILKRTSRNRPKLRVVKSR
jgi:DNA-binding phage protein